MKKQFYRIMSICSIDDLPCQVVNGKRLHAGRRLRFQPIDKLDDCILNFDAKVVTILHLGCKQLQPSSDRQATFKNVNQQRLELFFHTSDYWVNLQLINRVAYFNFRLFHFLVAATLERGQLVIRFVFAVVNRSRFAPSR